VGVLKSFGKIFNTVVIGCIVAYLTNPLASLFERKFFKNLKKGKWAVSVLLAFATVVLAILAVILLLVPQLVSTIAGFIEKLPEYKVVIHSLMEKMGLTGLIYIPETAEEVTTKFGSFVSKNSEDIAGLLLGILKGSVNIAIGAVLAIYLLLAKTTLIRDGKILLAALLSDERYKSVLYFAKRCNFILKRYLVFSLLDSLIVGVVNALAMMVFKMPYVGLLSVIAGITNLIPTFGPVIGGVIGALLLLLESPKSAIIFIIITVVLQLIDGYVLKPRLFGNSLGVSGLLILLAIVTMGNAFGIGGILLAIPVAAICDFTYREEILPSLQRRRAEAVAEEEIAEEHLAPEHYAAEDIIE
jgi:predicted PurR-regulated permease PerM